MAISAGRPSVVVGRWVARSAGRPLSITPAYAEGRINRRGRGAMPRIVPEGDDVYHACKGSQGHDELQMHARPSHSLRARGWIRAEWSGAGRSGAGAGYGRGWGLGWTWVRGVGGSCAEFIKAASAHLRLLDQGGPVSAMRCLTARYMQPVDRPVGRSADRPRRTLPSPCRVPQSAGRRRAKFPVSVGAPAKC